MKVKLRQGFEERESVTYNHNGDPRLSDCNCIWNQDNRCDAKRFVRCFPQYELVGIRENKGGLVVSPA